MNELWIMKMTMKLNKKLAFRSNSTTMNKIKRKYFSSISIKETKTDPNIICLGLFQASSIPKPRFHLPCTFMSSCPLYFISTALKI